MPIIRRSALVEHPTTRMFDLVNDIDAYPRRFDWCSAADVIERADDRLVARLDLGLGSLSTWFTTENTLERPHRIHMNLVDGPFRKLHGEWEFIALEATACKVSLSLDFEPRNWLLAPAMLLGFQGLADRMVDDFIKVADQGQ